MRRLPHILALAAVWAARAWGQVTPLECGVPVDGSIEQSPGLPPAHSFFSFSAQQGDAVYIRVLAYSNDPDFKLALLVSDPYGNRILPREQIEKNNQSPSRSTPTDLAQQGAEYDLPVEGVFTIRIQSQNDAPGNFSLIFTRLNRPCSLAALGCGQATAGLIGVVLQMDSFQFPARQGDIISVQLLCGSAACASTDPKVKTKFLLAVYGPDGHVLNGIQNPIVPTPNPNAPPNPVTFRLPQASPFVRSDLTVPANGLLTIMVLEASGIRGGPYYVSATRLNGACSGASLTCGSVSDGQLASPLSIGSYSLKAAAGDVYSFRVARSDTAGAFVPSAEVYDSQGKKIAVVGPAVAAQHAVSSSSVTFPFAGEYFVLVQGPLNSNTGGYSISATRLNRPCGDQALSCASVVDGAISGLLRMNTYSLAASKNDVFLLRLLHNDQNPSFRPRVDIYDPQGNAFQFLNTNDLGRLSFTVPSDGAYTFLATDSFDNAQAGAYTLSLARLNRPCNAATLGCGALATGSFSRPLGFSVYTYNAAAGESFTLRMMDNSGALQPAIEVYDAQANPAGQNMPGNFTGVDVVGPAGGAYTAVAMDTSKHPSGGSFGIGLLRTKNACAAPSPQGQTVSGVISGAEPFVSYSLPAKSGDALAVRSASLTSGFAAQMELYGPDGARLDAGAFGLSRKVAATGRYTVIVGASAPRTGGGYLLSWQLLNSPTGASGLQCGGSTTASLSASSQFRYYAAGAKAGDVMRLVFTRISDNFSPQIELFDPAGNRLAATSDVTQKASADGNYLVMVSPSTSNGESGSFTVAYQRTNNPCSPVALACGQTALRQVNIPGQLDAFAFTAVGGDQTTIRLTPRSGSYSPFVELYKPDGVRLATSSNGLLRSVLPADGAYSLLVRDRGAVNTGSYRVSLQDDSNPCAADDAEPPTVTLLKPTGGEVAAGGIAFRIQWQSDDNVGIASHDVALSTDGGQAFAATLAAGLSGNAQTYDWAVPADIPPSRAAVIRVTATDAAGNAQSVSSGLLSLIGSGFTPNSSATYTYDSLNRLTQAVLSDGRTIQYTWDAAGNLVQVTISGQ